jgi:DNA repair exonuclease SbcCD ATPase subunit
MRALAFCLAFLLAGAAGAQEARLQEALKRMQALNQRLAADKAQLEREKLKLEQERSDAAKSREALEGRLKSSRGAAAKSAAELQQAREEKLALEARLAQAAQREAALKTKLAETEQALAGSRRDGELLKKRIANQSGTIGYWQERTGSCQAKNAELGRLGGELVERYRAKTCADVERETEPFTGIGRARLENLLEEYKDKLRAQTEARQ